MGPQGWYLFVYEGAGVFIANYSGELFVQKQKKNKFYWIENGFVQKIIQLNFQAIFRLQHEMCISKIFYSPRVLQI